MFTGEVDCTYFFTWDTKYACVHEKEALLCGVSDGKQRFDLSALARHSGRRPEVHENLPSRLLPHQHGWKCCYRSLCQLIVSQPFLPSQGAT